MGCDIHSYAERRNKQTDKWEKITDHFSLDDFSKGYYKKEKGDHPFDWRSYSMFAFLAGVRNYDHCNPISEPRGIPHDISDSVREEYKVWDGDSHSASFLSAKELLEFDYGKEFWNRRVVRQTGPFSFTGAGLAEEGEGEIVTYRDNLGEWYFKHLDELKQLGDPKDVRIIFWFDN